jgi:hypothetical protein
MSTIPESVRAPARSRQGKLQAILTSHVMAFAAKEAHWVGVLPSSRLYLETFP